MRVSWRHRGTCAESPGAMVAMLILGAASPARANAIYPLFNFARPGFETVAAVLTVVIIFIETAVLRRAVPTCAWRTHFRRSAVANILSSLAGALYIFLFPGHPNDDFSPSPFLLFCLTVFVEIFVYGALYHREIVPRWKAFEFALRVNFWSYLLLVIGEIVFVIGALKVADIEENRRIRKWNDESVFEGEAGSIWTTYQDLEKGTELRRFDVRTRTWAAGPKDTPRIDHREWDAAGEYVTYYPADLVPGKLVVMHWPDWRELCRIPGLFSSVKLSPDGKKLAAIVITEVRHDDNQLFGGQLSIIDLERCAVERTLEHTVRTSGMAWNGSTSLYFIASDTEESRNASAAAAPAAVSSLFAFDAVTGNIRRIDRGEGSLMISSIAGGNALYFVGDGTVSRLDLAAVARTSTDVSEDGWASQVRAVSPGGTAIIRDRRSRRAFHHGTYKVVEKLGAPEASFLLSEDAFSIDGGFVWTSP